ncbi:unnamed protein product [Spirodela intermedia]|uniref:Uncharacterized protein n=1 Tax=Spirodela intermedia TaxID=51605 RepID=A0A7I8KRQ4_SPIIN|nr:unnamed protein product [Spirodela intermedia]
MVNGPNSITLVTAGSASPAGYCTR